MSQRYIFRTLIISISLSMLAACGGGGGSLDTTGGPIATPLEPGVIVGSVVDAPVANASVSVYAWDDATRGERLASTTTNATGIYSLSITSISRPVLIEATGGSYIEETSGRQVNLTAGQVLRAVAYYQEGNNVAVSVTPWTNVGHALATYKHAQGEAVLAALSNANRVVNELLQLDSLTTMPADITNASATDTVLTNEMKYGFYLAALSQQAKALSEANNVEPHTIYTSIALSQLMHRDVLFDGHLDGLAPGQLAAGSVKLTVPQYRRDLAADMVRFARNEEYNKSGVPFADVLANANRYAISNSELWDGKPVLGLDSEGPSIEAVLDQEAFYAGTINFAVDVDDFVGVASVVFAVDDVAVGSAADVNNPIIPINTLLLTEGEHIVKVTAEDFLGNITVRSFVLRVDNEGVGIVVNSDLLTNTAEYVLLGQIVDDTTPSLVTVNGITAAVDASRNFNLTLNLTPGENPVVIAATDQAGNTETRTVIVRYDAGEPQLVTSYSQADFQNDAGLVYQASLSAANALNDPLFRDIINAALNGTVMEPAPLNAAGIPFISMVVSDPAIAGIGSATENIQVNARYGRDGSIVRDFYGLNPIADSSDTYIFPLATEMLAEAWLQGNEDTQHFIDIEVIDEAGNAVTTRLNFKVVFDVSMFGFYTDFPGSTISVYRFDNGQQGGLIGMCGTSALGDCTIAMDANTGPVVARLNGGVYIEPVNNTAVDNENTLSAYLNFDNNSRNVYITPLAGMQSGIVEQAIEAGATPLNAILLANNTMIDVYGFNPLFTAVADSLAGGLTEEIRHAMLLAGLSEYALATGSNIQNFNSLDLAQMAYADVVADGLLDGIDVNGNMTFAGTAVDANTYRFRWAVATVAAANAAGVGGSDLANAIVWLAGVSLSDHPVFGDLAPIPLDFDGAAFTIDLSAGSYSGNLPISVSIPADENITDVELYIDGALVGTAEDLNAPNFVINTNDYDDGEHVVRVEVTDISGNTTTISRTVTFDNTAPELSIVTTTVNTLGLQTVSGNVSDATSDVATVLVNGVSATVNNVAGTWSVELDVNVALFNVSAVALDAAGNSTTAAGNIQVMNVIGPELVVDLAAGSYAGLLPVSVSVSADTDLTLVALYVDGVLYGTASNLNAPSVVINTVDFSDGEHIVRIEATNAAGGTSVVNRTVTFDNTAPLVSIATTIVDGQGTQTVTGSVSDITSGVSSVVVNGVNATVNTVAGTWSAVLNVNAALYNVSAMAVDAAGNSASASGTIEVIVPVVDVTPPTMGFDYSLARFSAGGGDFALGSLNAITNLANSPELTFVYRNLSLNELNVFDWSSNAFANSGLPQDRQIMYFTVGVSDDISASENITVEYALDTNFGPDEPLVYVPAVRDGNLPNVYAFPLVSDLLGSKFFEAGLGSTYTINVRARDAAGNTSTYVAAFDPIIVVPAVDVVEADVIDSELLDATYAGRDNLHGSMQPVYSVSYVNDTGVDHYLNIEDVTTGLVSQAYTEGERIHRVNARVGQQWRTRRQIHNRGRYWDTEPPFNPPPDWNPGWQDYDSCDIRDWSAPIDELTFLRDANADGDFESSVTVTADATTTQSSIETDNVEDAQVIDAWATYSHTGLWSSPANNFIVTRDTTSFIPELIDRHVTDYLLRQGHNISCPDTNANYVGWQTRYAETYESLPGFPRNEFDTGSNTSEISNYSIEITVNGTFVANNEDVFVPPDATVVITLVAELPDMPFYNDTSVANQGAFSSYDLQRLDDQINWAITPKINLSWEPAAVNADSNANGYESVTETVQDSIDVTVQR